MELSEFLTKYAGKKVDFDGAYGAQCVDLFRQYCKDVLNIPHTGAVEGAEDLWTKYNSLPLEMKYFDRIDGSKIPQRGDVAIWASTKSNKYGHVAIILGGNDEEDFLVLNKMVLLRKVLNLRSVL